MIQTNKTHLKIIALLLLLISLVGCDSMAKVLYGIKDPKVENKETLTTFLKNKKLSIDNVYCFDGRDLKQIVKLIKGVPDALIFANNKGYIPYSDDKTCNGSVSEFINNLNDTTAYRTVELIELDELLGKLRTLDGVKLNTESLSRLKNTKFIVFAFWGKWTGKLMKTKIRDWEKQANNNSKTTITFIKADCDMQDWWKADSSGISVK